MNLDSSILPHSIVENIEVECDRSLLDDNNIISQVSHKIFIYIKIICVYLYNNNIFENNYISHTTSY